VVAGTITFVECMTYRPGRGHRPKNIFQMYDTRARGTGPRMFFKCMTRRPGGTGTIILFKCMTLGCGGRHNNIFQMYDMRARGHRHKNIFKCVTVCARHRHQAYATTVRLHTIRRRMTIVARRGTTKYMFNGRLCGRLCVNIIVPYGTITILVIVP
jgi:hypothetical protein